MQIQKVNISEKFDQIDDFWNPRIIGALNGQHVKIARFKDAFIMHHHEHEDELFLVIEGTLEMEVEDRTLTVEPGEFVIIPRGVRHRPKAKGEAMVLMFEPASTLNTGDIENNRTIRNPEHL